MDSQPNMKYKKNVIRYIFFIWPQSAPQKCYIYHIYPNSMQNQLTICGQFWEMRLRRENMNNRKLRHFQSTLTEDLAAEIIRRVLTTLQRKGEY